MHLPRILLVLLAFFTLPGCHHSRGGTAGVTVPAIVAALVTGGGRVLLDQNATTRVLLGTILLRNTLAAGTANGDIRFSVRTPAGYEPDVAEAVLAPGQQLDVAVYTTLVVAAALSFSVFARYELATAEREFPLSWTNEAASSNALHLCQQLGSAQLAVLWYLSAWITPVGLLTLHSSSAVPPRLPALLAEIRMVGAIVAYFSLLELQSMFANTTDAQTFPDGAGPHGFTVPAAPLLPLQDGQYIAFWMSTQAPIPTADPTQRFQYAFVMDQDTNAANNYVPSASYPNDFFAGTDRWYDLSYAPATGWQLTCKQVGAGNAITTQASGARAILRGDTVLLLVPQNEFAVTNPPFRATSFAHHGDYGLNAPYDWSGDPTPTVAEGLHSWQ
jgi:hypothetical protein